MNTSKVKVRLSDIKAGKVIYISHPIYGIEKVIVTSRPYVTKCAGLFARGIRSGYNTDFSLLDAGIIGGDSYNGRRAFFKKKQAEAWADKWKNDPSFIHKHRKHLNNIRRMQSDPLLDYVFDELE